MEAEPQPRYCYRHPDRETGLSCSECGRPICYECMTPAPVGLRCPEHSGKPQGVRKVDRRRRAGRDEAAGRAPYPVTIALIAINVGVYLLELAIGGSADGTEQLDLLPGRALRPRLLRGSPPGSADGGWWRLVTAAFLHAGPIHLALNMLALYWFGRVLEHVIGSLRFLLLYVASGLAASAGRALSHAERRRRSARRARSSASSARCSCSSAAARSRAAARSWP